MSYKLSALRYTALALFVVGAGYAGQVCAQMAYDSSPAMQDPNQAAPDAAPMPKGKLHNQATNFDPKTIALHVEKRIQTLHDKLGITSDQEAKWGNIAQVMRDNEAAISKLIHDRHANTEPMTAVSDLESYQKIAQAHAEGLQKLIPAFDTLYSDMSDAQKKTADNVFNHFEGHPGHHPMKKHS